MKRGIRYGPPRVWGLLLVMLTLSGLVPRVLADCPLEMIELQGRQIDEMTPIIQSLVGADGVVTGMGNKLIVRTWLAVLSTNSSRADFQLARRGSWFTFLLG